VGGRWSLATAIVVACACLASADAIAASQTASLHLLVTSAGSPVAGASVVVNGTTHRTDERGEVAIDIASGPDPHPLHHAVHRGIHFMRKFDRNRRRGTGRRHQDRSAQQVGCSVHWL